MDVNRKLFEIAIELVKAMDLSADKNLPQEIADVVKLHSKIAAGAAWVPIPGVDVLAGGANIWGMYARINNKLNIPFGENIMKSIGSGVATNLASYVAVSGVASALKLIPGLGTFGGAIVLTASLYATTLASGWIYLKALTTLAKEKGNTFTENDVKYTVNEQLKDKETIKTFIDEAKKTYKN